MENSSPTESQKSIKSSNEISEKELKINKISLVIAVFALLLSIYSMNLNEKASKESDELLKIIMAKDSDIKNKLNEIENLKVDILKIQTKIIDEQENSISKIESLMFEQAITMKNMSHIINNQRDIIAKEFNLSEANIDIISNGSLFIPENHLVRYFKFDNLKYVIFVPIIITNKSKYPIDVFDVSFFIDKDFNLEKAKCYPIAIVKNEKEDPLILNLPEEFNNIRNDKLVANNAEFFKLQELPSGFGLKSFETKIGYMIFYTNNDIYKTNTKGKITVVTNKGRFSKNIVLTKDLDYFQPLSIPAKLLVDKFIKKVYNDRLDRATRSLDHIPNSYKNPNFYQTDKFIEKIEKELQDLE